MKTLFVFLFGRQPDWVDRATRLSLARQHIAAPLCRLGWHEWRTIDFKGYRPDLVECRHCKVANLKANEKIRLEYIKKYGS